MKNISLVLLATTFAACGTNPLMVEDVIGQFSYRGYDADDREILTGTIDITQVQDEDADGFREIRGNWSISMLDGASIEVGPQVGQGEFAGSLSSAEFFVNMNPNWADNNVFLNGALDGEEITGTWSYATLLGDVGSGRFVLRPR